VLLLQVVEAEDPGDPGEPPQDAAQVILPTRRARETRHRPQRVH